MSSLTIDMLLALSTVISQAAPFTEPETVWLLPPAKMVPVLKFSIGARDISDELCPTSPATSHFLTVKLLTSSAQGSPSFDMAPLLIPPADQVASAT